MTYRKTWFDYVLWMIYAGICVMLLAYVGRHIFSFYVGASFAGPGMLLPFLALFCLYPGIRKASLTIRKKHHFSDHAAAMTESLAVSAAFVFGLLFRLKEGLLTASIYEAASAFESGEYYEMAVVRAGADSQALAHGMSDLFVRCLRVVFSFLGNSMAAAVLFQIVLQMLALLFAYLAVRKAAGRFAACMALLLLSFSGSFILKIGMINPECMLLAVLLAGLCLVLTFVKGALCARGGFSSLPGALLLGVVLGLLCYLECSMAILFLFLAGLFTGKMNRDGGRSRMVCMLFLVLAGSVAGFLSAIGVDAAFSNVSFYQALMSWTAPYLNVRTNVRAFGIVELDSFYMALLFLSASFLVFVFIPGGREQDFSLWLLPSILLAPAFIMDFSVAGLGCVALFFWSVMAALGLKNTVFGSQTKILREKIEEINAAAEPIPAAAEPVPVPANPVSAAAEPISSAKEPVADAPEKKPRFIENPLPLPKKHVPKEMDYDYEVVEADMHFPLEISEQDDFDY